MSDKKVKISNILGSQIPDFIQADNPLFREFLNQYYESQEREYGTTYLSDNVASFKKIETVSNISLVEKQTVNEPGSLIPAAPVILLSLTYAYDDEITVNRAEGFPDTYGLLKIDNEIITYTGKRKNISNIETTIGDIDDYDVTSYSNTSDGKVANYVTTISGITTNNINIDDLVTLNSVQTSDRGDNIVVIDGTRVSSVGVGSITVDRPISGIATTKLDVDYRQVNPIKGSFTFTRESFTFTGCVRGFSGISEIQSAGNPEFLTFSDTNASVHSANSVVVNLSFLFVKEFYKKFRHNFLPGLEGRSFGYGLNVENILSRARDFYVSKGTDTSLKILFQVLYGEEVDIIKPFDQTILPSEAEWSITDDIVVESISGNPLNLVGVKIYQNSFMNPTASGTVSNVNTKFLGNKVYHQISFSKGTIKDKFKVSTKTKVVDVRSSSREVITVDSTIGFGETGNFYYLNADNNYVLAEYTSKSSNQFFGCHNVDADNSLISKLLIESDPIIDSNFVYGYEDNDLTKVCQMRIVGSIVGTADNVNVSKYFDIDELIRVKHLGEKYSVDDNRFNTWFYNNISYIDVIQHPVGTDEKTFNTLSEHFLKLGDRVDVIFKNTGSTVLENKKVTAINTPKQFQCEDGVSVFGDYIIKKRLNYASLNFGIPSLLSNIQNSFVDTENNAYVAFSGYPSFDTNTTNRSKSLVGVGIKSEFDVSNHNFLNGEKVYVGLTSTSLKGSNLSGYYYVKNVDDDKIKLSISGPNLSQNIFESLDITENSSLSNPIPSITPADLHDGVELKNQNNFKRIYRTPKIKNNNYNVSGPIGLSLNGVEYHSPIDDDIVYYGKIKNIEILNSGDNYDVVEPPLLSISDENGNGCIANANFSGSLTEVVLDKSGFDYLTTPSVSVVGGNGNGAICEAKMRGFTHSNIFNEFNVDVTNDRIGSNTIPHKFSDGEEVTYVASGDPIGIAGTAGNVGFVTDKLLSNTSYFVAKIDENYFKLAVTEERAKNKTKLIPITNNGTQTHTFRSKKIRKIIDRIIVNNSGSGYDKHQISVRSNSFPELLTTDYESGFDNRDGGGRLEPLRSPTEIVTGINTENNYIYAQNHNFESGDIVEYMCNTFDDRIVGLNTITQYKVTKISDDKFKLSDKGPDEDANYAVGSFFAFTNRLSSHTYQSGFTSWQQVDDHNSNPGFVRIRLNNLRIGEKYRISLNTDFQIDYDNNGRHSRINHADGSQTKFSHWDGEIGILTGEFTAVSEDNDLFQFFTHAVDANNRTANITDFKVELIENNIKDYERKIYTNLRSVGVGTHTFKYSDIKIKINGTVSVGKTDIVPDYYKASAIPVVKGKLKNIFITDGGVGYGVTDIINYIRSPQVKLLTGDDNASLRPIIIDGKINDVEIVDGGTNYTTPPNLEVIGIGGTSGTIGQFAELKSVVSDGKITDIIVVQGGSGYDPNNTLIKILPSGSGAIINAQIYDWQINSVKRYDYALTNNNNQLLQLRGDTGNKICSFYPVKEYRFLVGDNIDQSLTVESTDNHSKIVGWSYDGNPIYGPVGNRTGIGFTFMESGYKLNLESERLDLISRKYRPPGYENGFFIKDYNFDESGDLDVNNGKFVINSDFPEGTYAYFSTIDKSTKNPSFPYITFSHRDLTDSFNYLAVSKQTDENLNSGDYKRTVTHLGLNDQFKKYPLLQDSLDSKAEIEVNAIKSSTITGIKVDESGSGYKVKDTLNFNDPTILAEVNEVVGKQIVSVNTTNTIIDNLKFTIIDGKVTGISTTPHGLNSGDIVEITGISSTIYKNIEGVKTIGVTTVSSSLSTNIPNLNATGITTFVTFSDSTASRKFKVDDVVEIGSEQFLILGFDDVNNRYRVRREHNSTTETTHGAGAIVSKSQTEFTYSVSKNVKNKNIELPAVSYFEGVTSVGVGTLVSNVAVGRMGNNTGIGTIYKSIPAKAIYLPNHDFKDGDEVKLVSTGSTITATKDITLTNDFNLSDFDKLYCSKISDDFIGLSTDKKSFKNNQVFFKEVIVDIREEFGDDHKIEKIVDNVTGFLRKVDGTVTVAGIGTTTGNQHGLSVNDKFKLHITSNKTQTFDFRYNSTIGKLVVNPLSFTDTAIAIGNTANSTITINNHDFQTGDLIVYNASTPASPLVDNGVYYVIRDSINTIRLAENSYDISIFPINYISIGSTGGQDHQISKINPKLTFYKNNTINFVTSDSSLNDFDIDFYIDKNFKSKYNTNLITKGTGNIQILTGDSILSEFFYRIQGKKDNYSKTLFLPVDERVIDYSKIEVIDSLFNNKEYTVTGITGNGTGFNFNLENVAEVNSYTSSGFSSAFYSTNSTGEIGGVHSIKVLSDGINVDQLPIITSIETTSGVNAVLSVESDDIGRIDNTQVLNQGLEFSPDNTLKPKADSNVILKLKNTLTLESIGINSGGKNYTSPPNVLAIGKPLIVAQTSLNGSTVEDVKILTNDTGLSEDLRVIPVVNSNGIVVKGASTDSNQTVTLELRAPNPEVGSGSNSGFYNNSGSFPFKVGDEIFVENIKITNEADGYNSSDYNYKYFTVTGIDTTGGAEKVSYSIVGLGTTGGLYQEENNFGRVIKKDDLAVFTPVFKKTSFIDDEVVKVVGKNVSGTVAKNGWNQLSESLKVFDTTAEFEPDQIVVGEVSNNKGTVTRQFKFNFDLNVDSTATNLNGWKDDTGKLNLETQRIHDNDYYQRFSYSVKGAVPFTIWKDAIDSLSHVSGFKNFCNLGIRTTASSNLKPTSESDIELKVDIEQESSVHERFFYDMVSEDTEDENLSKLVVFNSKIITDYNESQTNKVVLIDDISSQFTGIVTSTGGGVIGTTSFNLFSQGSPLFHKKFNPSGINTSDHLITINEHNFNTGQRLIYKPETGQDPIGIAQTSDANAGVAATTLLPSEIFAMKIDSNTIQVAIAASLAIAGTAVSFTNVIGIGSTSFFSVPSEDATIRSLITIDNVIQSPVGITTVISVGLSTALGASNNVILLNDTSEILGKSLLKIEDEIIKVNLVGVGSTNSLNVIRGEMGTVAAAHTVGAAVTVVKGDYRVNEGKIYFSEAPYGPVSTGGIITRSNFSGRVYSRLNYDNNTIIDDISDRFDGSTKLFNLTSNGVDVSGVDESFGAFLINNIFQKPFLRESGSILRSDYEMSRTNTGVGVGQTIIFTGTSGNKDLPRGGIINEFDVKSGSGYQPPRKALFSAVVSVGGTIQSVGIASGGAGYLTPPLISVVDPKRHYKHVFISSNSNSVNVTGGSQLTPTDAVYISETGLLTLTIPNHGLTFANTVTLDNNSLIFRCSKDNYSTDHPYPRSTDPASGTTLEIMAFTTNTITLDVGLGGGVDAIITASIGTGGTVTSVTIVNPGTGYTNTGISTGLNFVTAAPPSPYKDIPLSGGNGSGATIDVVVGTGGSIVSFDMSDRGIGYEIGDNLQLTTLPLVGIGTSAFNITVTSKFQDKFAGWCFGQLIELDDISSQFNGFRKNFLLTRTKGGGEREYYSIVAQEGSGIILKNNFLIFINDVLQEPDKDFLFESGTRISFTEAPKAGSKFKIYFYTGSDQDFKTVDVDETIKPGDELRLQYFKNRDTNVVEGEQDNRIVYELIAADTVETTTYSGVGISTDTDFKRPTMWRKQINDLIIDGENISKERNYLAAQILPTTGIIKSVSPSDGRIYVKDAWSFKQIDGLDQTLNDISIVGMGTTAVVETIEEVGTFGDFGIITGIGLSATGINTTGPAIFFEVKPDPTIYDPSGPPAGNVLQKISRSGISTGDYFVIENTFIGNGVTGIKTTSSGPETVCVGNNFLDNVYYVEHFVSVGSSMTRIFANVNSISGINTNPNNTGLSTYFKSGNYSWGAINVTRNATSKSFTFHNQNGILGIDTSTQIIRTLPITTSYSL